MTRPTRAKPATRREEKIMMSAGERACLILRPYGRVVESAHIPIRGDPSPQGTKPIDDRPYLSRQLRGFDVFGNTVGNQAAKLPVMSANEAPNACSMFARRRASPSIVVSECMIASDNASCDLSAR